MGEANYAEVSSLPPAKEEFFAAENQCYCDVQTPGKESTASQGYMKTIAAFAVTAVAMIVLLLAIAACCVVLTLEVKSSSETLEHLLNI